MANKKGRLILLTLLGIAGAIALSSKKDEPPPVSDVEPNDPVPGSSDTEEVLPDYDPYDGRPQNEVIPVKPIPKTYTPTKGEILYPFADDSAINTPNEFIQ